MDFKYGDKVIVVNLYKGHLSNKKVNSVRGIDNLRFICEGSKGTVIGASTFGHVTVIFKNGLTFYMQTREVKLI